MWTVLTFNDNSLGNWPLFLSAVINAFAAAQELLLPDFAQIRLPCPSNIAIMLAADWAQIIGLALTTFANYELVIHECCCTTRVLGL